MQNGDILRLHSVNCFWYIAKRMQELGFTRDSLYIQDVLTPIKTKVLMLDTGEVKRAKLQRPFV